jgi:molybdenum cofactor cytidylyltransferase
VKLGVVILAAGASSRMGKPKMLLPWGATTVLGHLVEQWKRLGANHLAVVYSGADNAVPGELDRLNFPSHDRIINPAPASGMFSSIQRAAQWTGWKPGLTHWVIVLGDQPHLHRATLQKLIDFSGDHPQAVCQPSRAGRPRHPVVLPAEIFRELKDSIEENLKKFLQHASIPVALCELDDPGLDLDIDHPADYEKALQLFAKQPA